ncbi:hydrogenase maturation nickel metallochaperone HypA [Dehalobacter sp. DCM]|uniref:hydrogenase maturation nickel metallochaperone HypA n=1 Tax=Dehalobacter sp. DCM TaxID=2907827 RepID=UPI00308213CD|nr:hydrogenase maturation nickel metallochaperone HypA [Dehalobacter sp. DCM]
MHEMAITESVVEIVLKHADVAGAKKVVQVRLKIGEIRDIIHDMMEKCFRYIARGTIADEAQLEIIKVPLVVRCTACGQANREYISNYANMTCHHCGSHELELVSGNEFFIEDIKIL